VTSLDVFEQLLKETIGLDVESIGASAVERAVKERQAACNLRDAAAYWDWLRESADEYQAFVEAVVVPETWFFRDRQVFAALAMVARDWRQERPDRLRRVLSVPCSSGDEPYSMAITLLEAGCPPALVRIDAVDVSEQVLAKARRGIYGQNAFRGGNLDFRDQYFEPVAGGHRLIDAVRAQVHFQQGNLLAASFASDGEPYDVIFCRNLLIYFDRPTQDRAITTLQQLLTPDGVLFVGASEAGALSGHDFSSAGLPTSCAFRRGATPQPAQANAAPLTIKARAKRRPTPARTVAATPPAPSAMRPATAVAAAVVAPVPPDAALLDEAYRLADQGRFAEAAQRCEQYMRANGPSGRAFYLLGLVRDASGNHADAETFYRKTLYLDPAHREALVHLALLVDRQGKKGDARLLRDRLARLEAADRA
jgi:chemotaxis protein methyltransferase WspC